MILSPRGLWVMAGDIYDWRWEGTPSMEWVEGRGAAQHLTVPRTAPHRTCSKISIVLRLRNLL